MAWASFACGPGHPLQSRHTQGLGKAAPARLAGLGLSRMCHHAGRPAAGESRALQKFTLHFK